MNREEPPYRLVQLPGGYSPRMPSPETVPQASSENARLTMVANRRRDSRPELAVRSLLHAAGFCRRLDYAPGPAGKRRRADVVFLRSRIATNIDGCFWHGCPLHFIPPKSVARYLGPKIERNRDRDAETTFRLLGLEWMVLRY